MKRAADFATAIDAELELELRKSLLRLCACGSAGAGKTALIGRLLREAGALFDDEVAASNVDLRLVLDALSAEREQDQTLDVGYRFFSTERRRFMVADTPGREEFTRNMVTGASTADLAVLVVDATLGVVPQTRRHALLVSLLGIRHVVLAVNKMDLVAYSEESFLKIEADYRRFAEQRQLGKVTSIPVSATHGDNLAARSDTMPWYAGPTLLGLFDAVEIDEATLLKKPLRLPVQGVNRVGVDARGCYGTIVSGTVRPGDVVRIQPAGRTSPVRRIVDADGDRDGAVAGESITLVFDAELEIARGDMIAAADSPAEVAAQFEATVVWLSAAPLFPGRSYLLKIGTKTVSATIAPLKYRIDFGSLERAPAKKLEMNEIGVCNLELDRPIAFDPYTENRDTGGFILIDHVYNETVGAGMLHFSLRRAQNVHWQAIDVNQAARSAQKGQKPCVLWFTGLSGAGKSVIANLVDKKLHAMSRHTYLLDGDNVRHGLNKDLGFTAADRVENIRRVAEVAKLMTDAGLIVSTAFISPFREERRMARALLPPGEFIEIYVDTPLAVAEGRDPKGLYKKARRGELKNFTGIDSPYEVPEHPELRIDTTAISAEEAADEVIEFLQIRGFLSP